jgi:hypothetical protein
VRPLQRVRSLVVREKGDTNFIALLSYIFSVEQYSFPDNRIEFKSGLCVMCYYCSYVGSVLFQTETGDATLTRDD